MEGAVTPDPSCFGACTGCGRQGVPYEHRGLLFGGLCAFRGERLCPACRDACLEDGGVDILVVSYQPQVPPHVINTARDRDATFAGFVFPEQRGGYSHTPVHAHLKDEEAMPADKNHEDDFTADRHVDLDAGEFGMMADADYYDRIHAGSKVCGHEASQGGVAYRCERAPHPVDGYGPAFRHAAGIDAGYAERTDPGDERGQADLVTWGEDETGGDQEWELAWGTVADYGTTPAR